MGTYSRTSVNVEYVLPEETKIDRQIQLHYDCSAGSGECGACFTKGNTKRPCGNNKTAVQGVINVKCVTRIEKTQTNRQTEWLQWSAM